MWKEKNSLELFPNLPKSSTNRNVKDFFIFEFITEIWKRFSIFQRFGRLIEIWKEQKKRYLPQPEMWKIISQQKSFLKYM